MVGQFICGFFATQKAGNRKFLIEFFLDEKLILTLLEIGCQKLIVLPEISDHFEINRRIQHRNAPTRMFHLNVLLCVKLRSLPRLRRSTYQIIKFHFNLSAIDLPFEHSQITKTHFSKPDSHKFLFFEYKNFLSIRFATLSKSMMCLLIRTQWKYRSFEFDCLEFQDLCRLPLCRTMQHQRSHRILSRCTRIAYSPLSTRSALIHFRALLLLSISERQNDRAMRIKCNIK